MKQDESYTRIKKIEFMKRSLIRERIIFFSSFFQAVYFDKTTRELFFTHKKTKKVFSLFSKKQKRLSIFPIV